MSWDAYAANAKTAVGEKLKGYAILCHNGAKCCSYPQDLAIDQNEIAAIMRAVNDQGVAFGGGLKFQGNKYLCLNWQDDIIKGKRKECDGDCLTEDEKYFLYIRKCNTLVIVGCISNDPKVRNALIAQMDAQWEALHNY